MSKIIFILGGARSGKSTYALELADRSKKKKIAFIATAEARDNEMKRRILLHRNFRPSHWETFEEPCNVAALLEKIANKFDIIIVDCLTLFVCNLLMKKYTEKKLLVEIENVLAVLEKIKATSFETLKNLIGNKKATILMENLKK